MHATWSRCLPQNHIRMSFVKYGRHEVAFWYKMGQGWFGGVKEQGDMCLTVEKGSMAIAFPRGNHGTRLAWHGPPFKSG
eukprot:scaffold11338_cov17-Tisochrysis_lutea.AAC.1